MQVLTGFSFYHVTDDTRYRDPTMPFKTYVNLSVYMLRVLASLFNTCIVLYVPSPSVHMKFI